MRLLVKERPGMVRLLQDMTRGRAEKIWERILHFFAFSANGKYGCKHIFCIIFHRPDSRVHKMEGRLNFSCKRILAFIRIILHYFASLHSISEKNAVSCPAR